VKPIGQRLAWALLIFGGAAAGAVLTAPLIGSTPIDLRRAFDFSIPFAENTEAQIFFIARLPRTLAGALVGSTLATAGVVFQGLLRNPLATPFTLGVSAGAALGAMLVITFGPALEWIGIPLSPLASFAGSLVAVAVVYLLASGRQRGLSTDVLLLAGVTMNAFFSALILFGVSLLPFAIRMSGWLYLGAALVLGGGFIAYAVRIHLAYSDALARRTFRYSIFYLAALFAALLVDHHL
jgi:iron complex transport system permease protein